MLSVRDSKGRAPRISDDNRLAFLPGANGSCGAHGLNVSHLASPKLLIWELFQHHVAQNMGKPESEIGFWPQADRCHVLRDAENSSRSVFQV